MKLLIQFSLVCALAMGASFALAQIPDTQRSEGIAYISGGVGEEETNAILSEAKQWPVLLELSQIENGRGVWIFGAQIKVIDSQKKVIFDAQADGPYMLINLESGDYQIQASYQGVDQKRSVSVKAGTPQKIVIFWK